MNLDVKCFLTLVYTGGPVHSVPIKYCGVCVCVCVRVRALTLLEEPDLYLNS